MENIAVITGDIVRSTREYGSDFMLRNLKSVFSDLQLAGFLLPGHSEIFRGDSFQLVPCVPSDAMLIAVILRSGLIARVISESNIVEEDFAFTSHYDARLAIGYGGKGTLKDKISESSGEAFLLSGRRLDLMKEENRRLAVSFTDDELTRHLDISSLLADLIISSWSENSALAVYHSLLFAKTQKDIANILHITQPSVQNRLKIAHFEEIKRFIAYFKGLIN